MYLIVSKPETYYISCSVALISATVCAYIWVPEEAFHFMINNYQELFKKKKNSGGCLTKLSAVVKAFQESAKTLLNIWQEMIVILFLKLQLCFLSGSPKWQISSSSLFFVWVQK